MSKKVYNLGGGMSLHDARRVLGVPVIAHTGRVNAYARCMGGKLKAAGSVKEAQKIMKESASACSGGSDKKKK